MDAQVAACTNMNNTLFLCMTCQQIILHSRWSKKRAGLEEVVNESEFEEDTADAQSDTLRFCTSAPCICAPDGSGSASGGGDIVAVSSKSSRFSDGFGATRAGAPAVGGGALTDGGSCWIAASGGARPWAQRWALS